MRANPGMLTFILVPVLVVLAGDEEGTNEFVVQVIFGVGFGHHGDGLWREAKEENEVTRSREESHYDIVVALKNTSHIG